MIDILDIAEKLNNQCGDGFEVRIEYRKGRKSFDLIMTALNPNNYSTLLRLCKKDFDKPDYKQFINDKIESLIDRMRIENGN